MGVCLLQTVTPSKRCDVDNSNCPHAAVLSRSHVLMHTLHTSGSRVLAGVWIQRRPVR